MNNGRTRARSRSSSNTTAEVALVLAILTALAFAITSAIMYPKLQNESGGTSEEVDALKTITMEQAILIANLELNTGINDNCTCQLTVPILQNPPFSDPTTRNARLASDHLSQTVLLLRPSRNQPGSNTYESAHALDVSIPIPVYGPELIPGEMLSNPPIAPGVFDYILVIEWNQIKDKYFIVNTLNELSILEFPSGGGAPIGAAPLGLIDITGAGSENVIDIVYGDGRLFTFRGSAPKNVVYEISPTDASNIGNVEFNSAIGGPEFTVVVDAISSIAYNPLTGNFWVLFEDGDADAQLRVGRIDYDAGIIHLSCLKLTAEFDYMEFDHLGRLWFITLPTPEPTYIYMVPKEPCLL